MLNKSKRIAPKQNKYLKTPSNIWKIPFPARTIFQSKSPLGHYIFPSLFGVSGKKKRKKFQRKKVRFHLSKTFFFDTVYNAIFLFKKKKKKNFFKLLDWKTRIKVINELYKSKKIYHGYKLRQKRGGFWATALGFVSFMPKSHSRVKIVKKKKRKRKNLKLKRKNKKWKELELQRKKRRLQRKNLKLKVKKRNRLKELKSILKLKKFKKEKNCFILNIKGYKKRRRFKSGKKISFSFITSLLIPALKRSPQIKKMRKSARNKNKRVIR